MLSTTIEAINTQHKALIAVINKRVDAANEGLDKEVFGDIFKQLAVYAVCHFAARKVIPEYENREQQRKELLQQVIDICQQFEAGRISMTVDAMRFLKSLLTNHIIDVDNQLDSFFLSNGLVYPFVIGWHGDKFCRSIFIVHFIERTIRK